MDPFVTLAGASGRLSESLARISEPVTLAGGETLFHQGDPGEALYAVASGMLEVSVLSPEGRKLTLNTLGPGDVFGEIALFDGGPRSATVHARAASRLARVRRARLIDELSRDADLAADLLALAGRRLRWISTSLEEATFLHLSPRLARRVLHLAERFGAGDGTLAFSQVELAEQLGATREAVARVIGVWRHRGWIEPARGRLRVTDAEALAREAETDPA